MATHNTSVMAPTAMNATVAPITPNSVMGFMRKVSLYRAMASSSDGCGALLPGGTRLYPVEISVVDHRTPPHATPRSELGPDPLLRPSRQVGAPAPGQGVHELEP